MCTYEKLESLSLEFICLFQKWSNFIVRQRTKHISTTNSKPCD